MKKMLWAFVAVATGWAASTLLGVATLYALGFMWAYSTGDPASLSQFVLEAGGSVPVDPLLPWAMVPHVTTTAMGLLSLSAWVVLGWFIYRRRFVLPSRRAGRVLVTAGIGAMVAAVSVVALASGKWWIGMGPDSTGAYQGILILVWALATVAIWAMQGSAATEDQESAETNRTGHQAVEA